MHENIEIHAQLNAIEGLNLQLPQLPREIDPLTLDVRASEMF